MCQKVQGECIREHTALICFREIIIDMEASGEDHRTTLRHRVLLAAAIEFGSTKIPCTVRSLSDTGAAIETNTPLWFPDEFVLRLDRDGSCWKCRIVWRRDRRIGIRFK